MDTNSADGKVTPSQPFWVTVLHRSLLFGEPDPDRAHTTQALWEDHFGDALLDPETSSTSYAVEVIQSAIGHIGWRFRKGPVTPLPLASWLLLLALISPALLGGQSPVVVISFALGAAAVGLLVGLDATEVGRTRHGALRFVWAVLAALTAINAVLLISADTVIIERIGGIGVAVVAGGFALHALRKPDSIHAWIPWAFLSIGGFALAATHLIAAINLDDAPASLLLSTCLIELVGSTLLGRLALGTRRANLPATEPTQPSQ